MNRKERRKRYLDKSPTFSEYVEACDRHFQFLELEFGYNITKTDNLGKEYYRVYEKSGKGIKIEYELFQRIFFISFRDIYNPVFVGEWMYVGVYYRDVLGLDPPLHLLPEPNVDSIALESANWVRKYVLDVLGESKTLH